ncbi:cell wall integrity and stress response component 2-like isoform X2 [Daphnia pulex]|uniref:cell wall integrity and stress response component 2-like isoform X2 n=1 Tax=Daphnia pulex TaxID=6669 RepID=UPI001EDFF41B|nr:cell wall integrity and stress response component 2-like isoform X2 [Daphnia pulex]XP_046462231.1 cell wall integrity and stress response component 2-like isoform X2 [Daphnia pulex]XP_046462232.1 cell wall integrity and stress response component 2-like isoform X2 [Daphnia pulex]
MELGIVFLYSLLLVTARSQPALSGSTHRDEWPESPPLAAGPNEERIDPLMRGRDENPVITSSALEEQLKNDANSVSVSDVTRVHRTISDVTGRGKRRWKKRAAEILVGTSVKHQVAGVSSAILPPETSTQPPPPPVTSVSNSTHVPDSSSQTAEESVEPSSSEPATTYFLSSSTPSTPTTLMETTASVTGVDLPLSSSSIQPELQDESVQSYQTVSTSAQSSTTTTSTTTPANSNADEYVADDASSSSSTTDANLDDEETTIVTDQITISPSPIQHPEMESEHANTWPALMDQVNNHPTTTTSPDTSARPLLAVSSVVAVGRALSQEESVPWPEAKSTKVIGTIIEDIHGPFSDGVSSVSTISPDVLTSSGIAAIVMCIFLVLVTTAGASGYWWYRRRYLLNRPETLSERYAPSETGLGAADDIFRVGYVHSPELPRDSSEEMYSLDNDSFLTSLEAMTIPTYWTETIKHTKL